LAASAYEVSVSSYQKRKDCSEEQSFFYCVCDEAAFGQKLPAAILVTGGQRMKKQIRQLAINAGNVAQRVGETGKSVAVAASSTSGEVARTAASSLQRRFTAARSSVADATNVVSKTARAAGERIGDKLSSAGEASKSLAVAASHTSGDVARAAAASLQNGLSAAKTTAADATYSAGKVVRAASDVAGAVGASAVRTASTVGTTLLDQNGDGQLDQTDVKIATEKTVAAVKATLIKVHR